MFVHVSSVLASLVTLLSPQLLYVLVCIRMSELDFAHWDSRADTKEVLAAWRSKLPETLLKIPASERTKTALTWSGGGEFVSGSGWSNDKTFVIPCARAA